MWYITYLSGLAVAVVTPILRQRDWVVIVCCVSYGAALGWI